MREILFRGWWPLTGEWLYGNLTHYSDNYKCIRDSHMGGPGWQVDENSVGQYVGQTDKKNKKIFEGDIVVLGNHGSRPLVVKFIDFSWQCVSEIGDTQYRHRIEGDSSMYEVIGNIYENKEILEAYNG